MATNNASNNTTNNNNNNNTDNSNINHQSMLQYPFIGTASEALTITRTPPTRPFEATYYSRHQEAMLNAFGNDGEYGDLIKVIMALDAKHSPSKDTSRLLLENAEADMYTLLAQRSHDELRAILRNELPQKLESNDFQHSMRRPDEGVTKVHDRVIYANYIVDNDLLGVPTAEYCKFLIALVLVMEVEKSEIPAEMVDQADEYGMDAGELKKKVNFAFAATRGADCTKFDFLNDRLSGDSLREVTKMFVTVGYEQTIPRAEHNRVKYINIPAEAGVSVFGNDRYVADMNMDEHSPEFSRLIQLVLRAVFPDSGFHLEQVYLFHIVQASQADIGETLASILCNSYLSMGGVNTCIAEGFLADILAMTQLDWNRVANFVKPNDPVSGLAGKTQPNLEAYGQLLQRQTAEQKQIGDELLTRLEANKALVKFSKSLQRLNATNAKLGTAIDNLEDAKQAHEKKEKEVLRRIEKRLREEEAWQRLQMAFTTTTPQSPQPPSLPPPMVGYSISRDGLLLYLREWIDTLVSMPPKDDPVRWTVLGHISKQHLEALDDFEHARELNELTARLMNSVSTTKGVCTVEHLQGKNIKAHLVQEIQRRVEDTGTAMVITSDYRRRLSDMS